MDRFSWHLEEDNERNLCSQNLNKSLLVKLDEIWPCVDERDIWPTLVAVNACEVVYAFQTHKGFFGYGIRTWWRLLNFAQQHWLPCSSPCPVPHPGNVCCQQPSWIGVHPQRSQAWGTSLVRSERTYQIGLISLLRWNGVYGPYWKHAYEIEEFFKTWITISFQLSSELPKDFQEFRAIWAWPTPL